MSKYIVDTEAMTVVKISSLTEDPETVTNSLAKCYKMIELLNNNHGTVEYNGIIKDIQEWYYGSLVKAAWCATALSYFANQVGLDIGGKAENVYTMLQQIKKSSEGKVYEGYSNIPDRIEKGDILFWCWDGGTMNSGSSKHVGIAEYGSSSNTIYCIGGNQSDKICTKEYEKKYLYAIFRANS